MAFESATLPASFLLVASSLAAGIGGLACGRRLRLSAVTCERRLRAVATASPAEVLGPR